jgi:hypothetical protein
MDAAANIDAEKPATCWGCGRPIGPEDAYCRFCGRGQGTHVPWQYKHWGVITLTLLGLGPFSLFYVWRSPVISRGAKQVYTALILLATYYVVAQFYRLWVFYQGVLGGMQSF